ncbi:transcriptional repressor [Scheffersomyces coipomensis]|uniref:transcriptional repressor n=1 Tax=Scheffersomyces coipomensis TaxID=1788519 RepID=UPI00315C96AB
MFVVKQSNHQYQEASSNVSSRQGSSSLPSFNELLTSIPLPTEFRNNSTTSSASGSPYIQYNGISSPLDHRRYSNSTPPIPNGSQSTTSQPQPQPLPQTTSQPSSVIIQPLPISATMVAVVNPPTYQYNPNPYQYQFLQRQSSQQQLMAYQYVQPQQHFTQQQQQPKPMSINTATSTALSSPSSVPLTLPTPPSSSNSHRSMVRSNSMNSIDSDGMSSPTSVSKDLKRKHICKVCSRSFTTSGHLARHNRIHTGERKHVCPWPTCEARFARQDNCMQHYKTHTNGKNKRAKGVKKPLMSF